ncbi:unnamed protein product [Phaedon cochleariae]|uniref:MICOS complex subunit n=1 Tax=Phaedon cochleariae TaxID=80249 RepID=A0A9P0GT95_PHACE|nr:unnamed protein product [Phaedon cochleariae]
MFGQVVKKALLPAAAVVVESKIKTEVQKNDCFCRPSELPIYTSDPPRVAPLNEPQEPPSALENAIRTTRQTITKYSDEISAYKRVAVEQFDKSKENVEWLVDYLREEDNTMPKAGAVGIGALTGLIFGLRGGLFKKTLYATTGALGMGAVCYPKQATEYSQIGLTEGKKYLTIAYNFVYGVKKDDPPLELPTLPKLPSSFSEAWRTVTSSLTSFVSDGEELQAQTQDQVIENDQGERVGDALSVVRESRDEALAKGCHCPIGACLGHSEAEERGSAEAQSQTEAGGAA